MTTITRAAVLVAASTFAFAGCASDGSGGGGEAEEGFTDKTAQEIKADAIDAMKSLTSLKMSGEVNEDGQVLSLDLTLETSGDCQGSISAEGAHAEIISVDGNVFLKGDEKFWSVSTGSDTQGAAMAKLIGDRWVDTGESGGFGEICDLDNLITSFEEDDGSEAEEKGDTQEINGQEAIAITGEDDNGDQTTGWVATAEEHYILRMEQLGGEEPGQIDFSDFNTELDIEAPTGDDVVDLSSLS